MKFGARSAAEVWEAALGELELQVSRQNYRTWLARTVGLEHRENAFIVGVPNVFVQEFLDKQQRSLIEKTLIKVGGRPVQVTFRVDSRGPAGGRARDGGGPMFNPRYTFGSFVVGSCNRLAASVAQEVAACPGGSHNPLFIWGGAGSGKTHLLHAIGHAAVANNLDVLCVSAERFTNEFVTALCERNTAEFHDRYRSVDMLLVDDIQFISGKEQTEESFFHTFDELQNAGRQIAVTGDQPPRSMGGLPARLRSRLEGGMVATVAPPDFATRLAILRQKAGQRGVELPQDSLELIAGRAGQNIRELEGMLNRVVAYSKLVRETPTPDVAARAIDDLGPAKPASVPEIVLGEVAASFGVAVGELLDRKRSRETALARQVAMYLLRQETECSLAQIGREMGGRDHSTVLHACLKTASEIAASPALARKVADISRQVSARKTGSALSTAAPQ